ncbi:MAG: PD-(D/E)XK nuclease family protein [Candidatus Eremiobacteraeota bacterium]|nr:PD-(D/E)XK nuclease family protein [Candidatus Eremiobacteraeota bacterium]
MERFSYSRIQAFETCPAKYHFTYIKKIRQDFESVEAFMGSRVHESLEFLYKRVASSVAPSLEEVLAYYGKRWEEAWSDNVTIADSELTSDHYRALGEKCLVRYYERYKPFHGAITIGLEYKADFNLDDEGRYPFTAVIDRLSKISDCCWEIHDYKTGSAMPTQQQLDGDTQLAIYQLALGKLFPHVREVALVWHYLAFDEELRSERTGDQIEELRSSLIGKIDTIASQKEFPVKTGPLCGWCSYKAICPAWRHEAALAAMSDEEKGSEPGLLLVDRYAAVSEELDKLEREKELLSKAIIEYADGEGLENLSGTRHRIRVWWYDQTSLPPWNDPRRADVEAILKAHGLWDSYSSLAHVKLSKALEEKKVPGEVLEALAPYVTRERSAKLYTKKK